MGEIEKEQEHQREGQREREREIRGRTQRDSEKTHSGESWWGMLMKLLGKK
jgi:hypothetical protein